MGISKTTTISYAWRSIMATGMLCGNAFAADYGINKEALTSVSFQMAEITTSFHTPIMSLGSVITPGVINPNAAVPAQLPTTTVNAKR